MKNYKTILLVLLSCLVAQNSSAIEKRNYIYIVGSSTVSPLMTSISEEFSRVQNSQNKKVETPLVESNGTSHGFQDFCSGIGYKYPDISGASRPIDKDELELCSKNGVKQIAEIKIGYDGIVFGNFIKSKKFNLTKEEIFLALAEKIHDPKTNKIVKNPYKTWNEINSKLPKEEILVFGPPLTSGTREIFVNLVMEEYCFHKKEFVESYPSWLERKKQCHAIRDDGKYINSGENDNLIIESLKNNPNAFGIFGFNFLVANKSEIQASLINGVEPSFKTISSKKYQLSRPLFVYFKKEHLKLVPEISYFIKELINAETIGSKGYLIYNGLVPLTKTEFEIVKKETISQL
ncbi:MAG: phosphate ABC transporter substrate-binding protein [Pelagibacterales bacterium]|nr:phosphate ABC transporter substrate-binding protein [Pelagibacterales bacterium]